MASAANNVVMVTFAVAVFLVKSGLERVLIRLPPNAVGQSARHQRIEVQSHGPDRQAGRLSVFSLAQPVHRTPNAGLHARRRGVAAELQDEELLFVG